MKKILSAILALCMIVSITACSSENESSVKGSENKVMRDITTQELIEDMGLGINLGNTFESCGNWINKSSVTNYETAWGKSCYYRANDKGLQGLRFWRYASACCVEQYDGQGNVYHKSRLYCKSKGSAELGA